MAVFLSPEGNRDTPLIIDREQHPGWRVNSWLIAGREEGRGLLIDTGADPPHILEMVRRHGVTIEAIVCSHRHYDHIAGNEILVRNLSVPVFVHPLEKALVPTATDVAPAGHRFDFGTWHADVIHLPGHTAGQIGLKVPGVGTWTADTLFRGSVGGTMGPGATSFEDLQSSVLEGILADDPETKIYPGHGDSTTVGHELERNPFVRLWRGLEQPGTRPGRVDGKRVTIEVWTRDYDAGHKAQVRFADDKRAIVAGSKVQKVTL
jgi:glyoxylase-like metal-dependent hydrolase (beta-lactamase superfamily II)